MTCMQHNIEQHISTKVTLPYYICWPAKLQETKLQKPCVVLVKMLNLNIFNLLFSSKNLPKPNKTAHYLYSIYTCRKEGGCTISHGRQGSPALLEPLCLGGGVLPVRTESCAQWQSSLKSAQHIANIGNTLVFQNFQDRLWEKQQNICLDWGWFFHSSGIHQLLPLPLSALRVRNHSTLYRVSSCSSKCPQAG